MYICTYMKSLMVELKLSRTQNCAWHRQLDEIKLVVPIASLTNIEDGIVNK